MCVSVFWLKYMYSLHRLERESCDNTAKKIDSMQIVFPLPRSSYVHIIQYIFYMCIFVIIILQVLFDHTAACVCVCVFVASNMSIYM